MPKGMLLKDVLLAVTAPTLWGAGFAVIKPVVEHFPPLLMMALVYAITLVALSGRLRWVRSPWWGLALVAGLGVTVQGGMIYTALGDLPASTTVLLIQLQVPFAVLSAWAVGKERLDGRRLVGMALAFAGVALVVGAPEAAAITPFLLVTGGSLAWGMSQAVVRLVGRDDGRTFTAGIALHALPQLVLASALLERGQVNALRTATLADWAGIATLGLGAYVLAYTIWYDLLARYRVDQIAPFLLLMPSIGVLTSALFLGEHVSWQELAGGAVILGGLAVVVQAPRTA